MPNLGLDLVGGAKLAAAEQYGDWYRDPWGWPELALTLVETLDAEEALGVARRHNGEYHLGVQPSFHLIEIPKSRLGVRPAVVEDPMSRLAYLSAVSAGLNALHRDLPEWVYGWRLRGKELAAGGAEWSAYVKTLPSTDAVGYGLLTDITSFFASIRPERLAAVVYGRLGRVTPAHVIMDVAKAHDSLSTRSGLPQRSFASAALVHAYLQPVDDALAAAADDGVVAVRRWMDDLSAEGENEALYALLMTLQERVRQLGLELNSSKTTLALASETAASLRLEDLREIEVPLRLIGGDEYGGEPLDFELDLDTLHSLEDVVLSSGGNIPRTVARAVLVSLTKTEEFSRHTEWQDRCHLFPHAAEAMGRYFRAAAEKSVVHWAELGDWFDQFEASAWGRSDWVSSQFALAFPAESLPPATRSVLLRWLQQSGNVQQVAIAVQRICSTDPVIGRNVIRARVDRTTDPLLLRLFALGLQLAGDSEADAEAILRRDPRNALLLRRMESRDWKAPAVVNDFDVSAPSEPG